VTDLLLRQAQASRAGAQGDDDHDVIGYLTELPRICHIRVRQSKCNNCAKRRLIGGIKHEVATIA
jgi:hypothetical protein